MLLVTVFVRLESSEDFVGCDTTLSNSHIVVP